MQEAKLQEEIIADLEKKCIPNYGTPNGAAQIMGKYALGRAGKMSRVAWEHC